jgi:hypothetical protein
VLLVLCQVVIAENQQPQLTPDLTNTVADPNAIKCVKVSELINALWYYHQYWILFDTNNKLNGLLDRYEKAVTDDVIEVKKQIDNANFWQGVGVISGSIALTLFVYILVDTLVGGK